MQFATNMKTRLQKESISTKHHTIKINLLKSKLNLASRRGKAGHVFWILKLCIIIINFVMNALKCKTLVTSILYNARYNQNNSTSSNEIIEK